MIHVSTYILAYEHQFVQDSTAKLATPPPGLAVLPSRLLVEGQIRKNIMWESRVLLDFSRTVVISEFPATCQYGKTSFIHSIL